jgi:hypothetical protein
MRNAILSTLAGIGLLSCIAAPILFFMGKIGETDYKNAFLVASIVWFLFATLRIFGKRKG